MRERGKMLVRWRAEGCLILLQEKPMSSQKSLGCALGFRLLSKLILLAVCFVVLSSYMQNAGPMLTKTTPKMSWLTSGTQGI